MELGYLSVTERTHLKELKESLLRLPSEYFFHSVTNFQEFKQITETMGVWQWHYIRSMCSSLMDSFKTLGKMFYSLANMHVSVAREQSDEATRMALSALTKLTLSFSLFCLQLTRFVTLALATFITSIASLGPTLMENLLIPNLGRPYIRARNYVSSFFQPYPTERQLKELISLDIEFREFQAFLLSASVEKQAIKDELDKLDAWCKHYNAHSPSPKGMQFFSDNGDSTSVNDNLVKKYSPEEIELSEMRREFLFLLAYYPGFDARRGYERGYVHTQYTKYAEHHTKVMLAADVFFKHASEMQTQAVNIEWARNYFVSEASFANAMNAKSILEIPGQSEDERDHGFSLR